MAANCVGACSPWASTDDLCSPCTEDTPGIEDWLAIVTDAYYELSGRRWPGSCLDTVRPCAQYLDPKPWPGMRRHQEPGLGRWWCSCSSYAGGCGCGGISEVRLPSEPITSIVEVKVDGVVLDPSLYRIDQYRWLVRLPDADGTRRRWPCCPDMLLPDTEDNTFSVTYTYGTPPPDLGKKAVVELACEFARACNGDEKCRLSPRAISVARQGVTVQLAAITDTLKDGMIGLPIGDLFLHTYNPTGKRVQSSVWSPDIDSGTRRVGT